MFSFYFNGKNYNVSRIQPKRFTGLNPQNNKKEASTENLPSPQNQQENMAAEVSRIREIYFLERRFFL